MSQNTFHTLWAIDPFSEDQSALKITDTVLRALNKRGALTVQPAYVLGPSQLNLSMEFASDWVQMLKPAALQALQSVLKKVKFSDVKPPLVLTHTLPSLRDATKTLLQYASKHKMDLAVVSTQNRKGVPHFFLGSFAENTLHASHIPLLAVHPKIKAPKKLTHEILFATDLSAEGESALHEVLRIAKHFRFELHLYHQSTSLLDPILQSAAQLLGGNWMPLQSQFSDSQNAAEKRLKDWAELSRKAGVKAHFTLDTKPGPIANNLKRIAAKRGSFALAVASSKSSVSSAILGSLSLQVIKSATRPVFVIRPKT